jgi:hypothetical protein
MKDLVTVTSVYPVGCTFLDWSINYLSGNILHFNVDKGWVGIPDDPLTLTNSHAHLKNHPSGLQRTQAMLDKLAPITGLKVLYPFPLHIDLAAKSLGIKPVNISVEDSTLINDYRENDYNATLNLLHRHESKLIFLSLEESMILYLTDIRTLAPLVHNSEIMAESELELRESKDLSFFKNAADKWGLHTFNKWDLRERLALDLRPFKYHKPKIDFSIPHYWLNCEELWFNGEHKILEIMNYLGIEIDISRLEQWLAVYRKWQKIQCKHAKFNQECNHIVDSIIHGWDFTIDLTFNQEVVIQHCLLYKHNLNLKTWQLEKFPSNTRYLHELLEENFHPLVY